MASRILDLPEPVGPLMEKIPDAGLLSSVKSMLKFPTSELMLLNSTLMIFMALDILDVLNIMNIRYFSI